MFVELGLIGLTVTFIGVCYTFYYKNEIRKENEFLAQEEEIELSNEDIKSLSNLTAAVQRFEDSKKKVS